jgi:translation initiation factor IF-2
VYEIAKELSNTSKEVVEVAKELGIAVKNHMSTLEEIEVEKIISYLKKSTNNDVKKKKSRVERTESRASREKVVNVEKSKISKKEVIEEKPIKKEKMEAREDKTLVSKNNETQQINDEKKIKRVVIGQTRRTSLLGRDQKKHKNNPSKVHDDHLKGVSNNKLVRKGPIERIEIPNEVDVLKDVEGAQRKGRNRKHKEFEVGKVEKDVQSKARAVASDEQSKENSQKFKDILKTKTVSNYKKSANHNKPKENKITTEVKEPVKLSDDKSNKRRKNYSENRGNSKGNWNRGNSWNNKKGKKGKKGRQQQAPKSAPPARKFHELPEIFVYTDGMSVADVAKKIKREPAEIVKKLFLMGIMATQNQSLDKDTLELLAVDYGMKSEEKIQEDVADIDKFFDIGVLDESKLISRPPVVTIMGHVDHGKTTLLDTLRNSLVINDEAGGITQHIGAYQIKEKGKLITFLDTPGHAAFTSMRARGASVTDITILVVAADDGVMPQTIEAINHAKAAEVPIIVAVNKIDKPDANPANVINELSEYGLISESWGGDTIFVEISAKFGQNIEELLEMVLLVAEMEDLKADEAMQAIGTVIEARLDKGRGPIATLLVQQGTLHVGDPIVVGNTYGRVRVMLNDHGRHDKEARPATPVEITGLNDVPEAGDRFVTFADEKTARVAGEERAKRALMEQRNVMSHVSIENLFDTLKEGEIKEVNIIIKADVQGSAEALSTSLQKIEIEGVRVKIVHSAVGAINESDVALAEASNAIIIGFNVRPTSRAKTQAQADEVDIRLHRIIYKVIEEVETAMQGMLDPEYEERVLGEAVVREVFKVSKVGMIAGIYVTDGLIQRDSEVRVIRDGVVLFEGNLASLKRFKDDVKEVKLGFEGGAMVENFNDIKVDDVLESYAMEEVKRK